MLTVRDFTFTVAGAFLGRFGSFLVYLVKRWIERRPQLESIQLDHGQLELLEKYVRISSKLESEGLYVSPPKSLACLVSRSLTPEKWERIATTGIVLHLRAVFTSCMFMEAIAAKQTEYSQALIVHRNEFVRWYTFYSQNVPFIFDDLNHLEVRSFHAYFYRITEETPTNIEGFFAALNDYQEAIDSGEIQIME